MINKILAINPGSTSTKFAIYHNENVFLEKSVTHSSKELDSLSQIDEQLEFRKNIIISKLEKAGINSKELDAVIGRGGLLAPIKSGVYNINKKMLNELRQEIRGHHASNLGALLAYDIAKLSKAKSYIADPVVVDELEDVARISGHPEFERVSIFHALNQKAIARVYAKSVQKKYNNLNLIVAHLGGGISIGAHKKGKVIDVNNAFNGEGPFSPERSGTAPSGALVNLCFSKKYSCEEILKMLTGKGGLVAYFNTNNIKKVIEMANNGNKKAELIYKAMAYQIGKEIGALSAVLKGKVDAILITGGIAFNKEITNYIKKMVDFISNVHIYPGEDELKTLAFNALLALNGELIAKKYV